MKKLAIVLLIIMTGCTVDPLDEFSIVKPEVPEALYIDNYEGIKLESYIVQDEVNINAKLPVTGEYRIRIKDFTNKVISQDKISGEAGDNILKVYVRTLEADSYTVELITVDNRIVGVETFSVK